MTVVIVIIASGCSQAVSAPVDPRRRGVCAPEKALFGTNSENWPVAFPLAQLPRDGYWLGRLGIAWAVASALRPAPTRPICGAAGASRMGGDPGAGHPARTAGSVGVWRAGEVLGEFPEPAGLVVVA